MIVTLMRNRHHPAAQRAFALLLVLWGVTLIAMLVTALARSSALEAHRFANTMNAAVAQAALNSGFAAGIAGLLDSDPDRRWHADGSSYQAVVDGVSFQIRINAENGRLDLNNARPELLARLLDERLGPAVVAQIVGQGRTILAAAQPGFRPMLSVMELAAVPLVDSAAFASVAGLVTVRNHSGLLDWHTADPAALALLPDMTSDRLTRLMAHRQESHYTPDAELARVLSAAGPQSLSNENQAFTMRLSAHMADRAEATADVVFRLIRNGTVPYRILEWRAPASDLAP
jgi:general secretion pathway protein K